MPGFRYYKINVIITCEMHELITK